MKSNGDVVLFVETKMECEIETLNEMKRQSAENGIATPLLRKII